MVLVRHGEILDSEEYQGEYPLSPQGLAEVAKVARSIANIGGSSLYSSPLIRAIETACYIARALRLPIQVTPDIAEYDPSIESWDDMRERCRSFLGAVEDRAIVVTHGGPIQCMVSILTGVDERDVVCNQGEYIHLVGETRW